MGDASESSSIGISETEGADEEFATFVPRVATLLPHQAKAVSWMIQRETSPVEGVCGGILGDDMGLGKTLSVLSLVSSDVHAARNMKERRATIVCCPSILVRNWIEESLKNRGDLVCTTLDALAARDDTEEFEASLDNCHVLVASYDQLSATYRKLEKRLRSSCQKYAEEQPLPERFRGAASAERISLHRDIEYMKFVDRALQHVRTKGRWPEWLPCERGDPRESIFLSGPLRRVVLDEAHYVRNTRTSAFRAVVSFVSDKRWCVSSTLVSNHVDDLYAVFRFLGVRQADTRKNWARSRRFSSGRGVEGEDGEEEDPSATRSNALFDPRGKKFYNTELIDRVMKAILLRRGKSVLAVDSSRSLPPIEREDVEWEFRNAAEKERHDALYEQCRLVHMQEESKRKQKADARGGKAPKKRKTTVPKPKPKKKRKKTKAKSKGKSATKDKGKQADDEDVVAEEEEVEEEEEEEEGTLEAELELETEFSSSSGKGRKVLGLLCKARQICTVPDHKALKLRLEDCTKPTMIVALVRSFEEEDSVVFFTQWKYCVQDLSKLIERSCRWGKRCFVLHSGLNDAQRWDILREFSEARPGAYLLTSYALGGTGLNMTSANRVVLIDHWFNRVAEDQAAARVHRIGQKRLVTITRLVVKNSVEDHVLRLQNHKVEIAEKLVPFLDGSAGVEELETVGSAESVFAKLLFDGHLAALSPALSS